MGFVRRGWSISTRVSLATLVASVCAVALVAGISWWGLHQLEASGHVEQAEDYMAALVPAVVAMGIIGLTSVLVVFAYSRRLSAPLRVFERAAREVASGGYVRPIDVRRHDELGMVGDAFNDMGVRLNSLQDMARLTASASNTDEVLEACLNALGHILGTGDAAVLLADDDESCLVLARGRGLAEPGATLTVWMNEPSPLVEAYVTQRPVHFQGGGPDGDGAIHRLFGAASDRTGVAVPVSAGPDSLGVTVVLAPSKHRLTSSQVDTLAAFNANAAVAIRTSRVFAEEQRSRREAEALRRVAELTSPLADLETALTDAGRIAADLLGYDSSAVVIERREDLAMDAAPDADQSALLAEAWRSIRPRFEDEAAGGDPIVYTAPGGVRSRSGSLLGAWRSALFIPLVYENTFFGAVVLVAARDRAEPGEREMATARSIGRQLSLAARNARLLHVARSRAANLETMFRISQTVSSELQPNVVLDRVLDAVQKMLSADAVALMSYDESRAALEMSMARGVVSREMLHFRTGPGGDEVPGQVIESRAPVVCNGLSRRATRLSLLAAGEGLESMLAVPLLARGRATGVLIAFSRRDDAFSAENMELLFTFAAQAALALDTAELYGREHHIASVVQQSLLPEDFPSVRGLETASFYLPAGRDAEIGGDYYDMFVVDGDRVALVIADVCGKGVRAATKTSMVKYTIRGLVRAGLGPADTLSELNRELCGAGDPSDIVTVWLGMLDALGGSLVCASGGHPAGLLRHGPGPVVERLAATGPLLGAVPGAPFRETSTEMGFGDLLLLCTDGVTEARQGVRLFGEGRVRRVLRGSGETARECVDGLLAAVERFGGGTLRDDAAAMAVRRTVTGP